MRGTWLSFKKLKKRQFRKSEGKQPPESEATSTSEDTEASTVNSATTDPEKEGAVTTSASEVPSKKGVEPSHCVTPSQEKQTIRQLADGQTCPASSMAGFSIYISFCIIVFCCFYTTAVARRTKATSIIISKSSITTHKKRLFLSRFFACVFLFPSRLARNKCQPVHAA